MNGRGTALAEATRDVTRTECCVHEYVQRPAIVHMIREPTMAARQRVTPPPGIIEPLAVTSLLWMNRRRQGASLLIRMEVVV